ncbi:hypothetical protein NEUTE1DRAFT_115376 [Neurospora tetrasperma FGSC 2508]|uniref:Uncharacterized protein n=1 Tax=Neurospora tetrasperma (strain FGSC 2508 / ATCC MYA-4615 / P0657) TaxID=510951 RepID=F8N506_NEUT8|nr:uncharacterized protein NEUTE1DRAFT_115376 [Neurospora tetrasperma FGSC 2508]EGO53587.1 hypothetical protein NEUTE1DRAFT_115376 [Neurospora tetrasperma FGSC 2508]
MDLHDVQWPRRTDKATNIDDVSADTRTLDSYEYAGLNADGKFFFSFFFLDKEGGGGWTYLEAWKMILHLLSSRVFTILVSDLEAVGEHYRGSGVKCPGLAGPTQGRIVAAAYQCPYSRLVPVPSSWDNQSFIMFNFLMMF